MSIEKTHELALTNYEDFLETISSENIKKNNIIFKVRNIIYNLQHKCGDCKICGAGTDTFSVNVALYVITIIPITSFIFFLYDIVLIIKNVRIVNFLAVIIPLIIGILDSITGTKKLSPIGLLSIFNEEPPIAGIPNLSGYLIVELIWLFVFVFINYIIQKKYQDTI